MIDTVIQWMNNALETVRLIGIRDILDICIVAYVVYRILLFIRRSRSGQVAKAILIIILALVVASTLQLRMVNFLLRNAVDLGLISLVIIFQPEIRRILERVGSGKVKELFVSETAAADVPAAHRGDSEGLHLYVQGQGGGPDGL